MRIHAMLWNEVDAFSFCEEDLTPLTSLGHEVHVHSDTTTFLECADDVDVVLTWDWQASWYTKCPHLQFVMTPAAGKDWTEKDPAGQVPLVHGTFHGPLLAESLLSAMLDMNHRMPAMITNQAQKAWDRNLQADCRLLRHQEVLIIGYGHIGQTCADLLRAVGATVWGVRATPDNDPFCVTPEHLEQRLATADHVALLLPGDADFDGYLSPSLMRQMKPGSFVYNFGRGNALQSDDLLACLDHLGGAFLDVTAEEPLPAASPLWTHPRVMITPHSSCIYQEYRGTFIKEVQSRLTTLETGQ